MADYTIAFSDLSTRLDELPANTVDTPYSIIITGLTGANVTDGYQSGTLGDTLYYKRNKYIDLSETQLPTGISLYRAFWGDDGLVVSPTIPASSTNLEQLFNSCDNLKSVIFEIENFSSLNTTKIFYGCTSLEDVYVPTAAAKTSLINKLVADTDYPSTLNLNTIVKISAEKTTLSDLNSLLQGKAANNSSNPYQINVVGLRRKDLKSSETQGTLGYILKQNPNKYVSLDPTTLSNKIKDLNYTFYNCATLVEAPKIPNNVTNLEGAFFGCTSLAGISEIPVQ